MVGLIIVNRDPCSIFFPQVKWFQLAEANTMMKMSNQAKEREVNSAMATHLNGNVFALQG